MIFSLCFFPTLSGESGFDFGMITISVSSSFQVPVSFAFTTPVNTLVKVKLPAYVTLSTPRLLAAVQVPMISESEKVRAVHTIVMPIMATLKMIMEITILAGVFMHSKMTAILRLAEILGDASGAGARKCLYRYPLEQGEWSGPLSIRAATRSQMFVAFLLFCMRGALRYVLVVMRKKSLKTSKSKLSRMTLRATKTCSTSAPVAAATEVRLLRVEPPHSDALLREAEDEPSYRDLREYPKDVSALTFEAWRGRQSSAPKTLNEYHTAICGLMNWLEPRIGSNPPPLRSKGREQGHTAAGTPCLRHG
jgi:hypothetical protein